MWSCVEGENSLKYTCYSVGCLLLCSHWTVITSSSIQLCSSILGNRVRGGANICDSYLIFYWGLSDRKMQQFMGNTVRLRSSFSFVAFSYPILGGNYSSDDSPRGVEMCEHWWLILSGILQGSKFKLGFWVANMKAVTPETTGLMFIVCLDPQARNASVESLCVRYKRLFYSSVALKGRIFNIVFVLFFSIWTW